MQDTRSLVLLRSCTQSFERYFESLFASAGAKIAYALDINHWEGRTWDNDGRVEDIATGSAVGLALGVTMQARPQSLTTDAERRLWIVFSRADLFSP